jgi:ABC-type glutathione transport system ATPase component
MVALGLQRTSRHQELRGPAAIPAPVAIGGDALTAASHSPAPPAVPPRTRITVRNVTKAFGGNAQALALLQSGADRAEVQARTGAVVGLHKVSFDVAEGEILVVMGLSGSGKSTLLRCLNRLIEPSSGSVAVDGTEVTALSGKALLEFRRAKFGMVFQSFALFPNRTVLGNVEYGLEIQGMVKAKRRDMAMRRSRPSASRAGTRNTRTSFRAACSSGPGSPGRSPPTRPSFSWTRPSPPSTR